MRYLKTKRQQETVCPIFLPVFEYGRPYADSKKLIDEFNIDGVIMNAYFLYKRAEYREQLLQTDIKEFTGFNRTIVTDSGAFQQFSGPLYLSNKKIIQFQEKIGADVISPLDLITTPGDNKKVATKKMEATLKRIEKGLEYTENSILIGVQQGGRFLDLRMKMTEALVKLDVEYIALGSLVPFFTRNHNIEFVLKNILQTRNIIGEKIPIHLYGGGDPSEIPFYAYCGCDIFDSSSFIHYANDNWYMTPFGAVKDLRMLSEIGYECLCPYCKTLGQNIQKDTVSLAFHNLWVILKTINKIREFSVDEHLRYLENILEKHTKLFPESKLGNSWNSVYTASILNCQ